MRTLIGGAIAGIALILLASTMGAPAPGRPPAYEEKEIGQYPPYWGDLVGVASHQATLYLIFRDGSGNLRRVAWNPNGVALRVDILSRKA